MFKEFVKHKFSYLVLLICLAIGVILFLGAWPDRQLQRVVGVGLGIFYFLWGVVTHLNSRFITRQVVLEYMGVGVLAGLLLVLITL